MDCLLQKAYQQSVKEVNHSPEYDVWRWGKVIVFPHILERQNMNNIVGSMGDSKPFALVCWEYFISFLIITTIVIMLQDLSSFFYIYIYNLLTQNC